VIKILFIAVAGLLLGWLFWGNAGFLIMLIPIVPISLIAMIAYAALENVTGKDCGRFTQALGTKHYKN
jgi:hypothetical protein